MSTKAPLIFIALCAMEKTLARQWAASGELPNIAKLLATGYEADTKSLDGLYVGANWPSLQTACTPAKNRVYSWMQLEPGTYNYKRCEAGINMQRPAFWDQLSQEGRKVCIFDIPHSTLSQDLNGLQTVEWGAHDGEFGFRASSGQLRDDIIARFGRHPVSGHSDADRTPEQLLAFRDELIAGAKLKGRFSRYYLDRERPDFFAQVFTEAHCAGHLCWHLHDSDYLWHGGTRVPDEPDSLKMVYQAIDEGVGELLKAATTDANVVLLFSHGMGPMYNPYYMLEDILLRMGVAQEVVYPEAKPGLKDYLDKFLTWGWQRTPASIQKLLQPLRQPLRNWAIDEQTPPPRIDMPASRVFSVDKNHAHAGLRVNLVGREPAGKVQPGDEYEQLLASLTEDFNALVNKDTGEPLVEDIYRTDELYEGPERDHLPDLMVLWRNEAPVERICSDKIGTIEQQYRYVRSGEHNPFGLMVVNGASIPKGKLGRTVSILDVAPTLAAILGVELNEVDGRPIPEIVELASSS
jgi:predicted AlkP superfamily phosphohydrolase/phosphomutase